MRGEVTAPVTKLPMLFAKGQAPTSGMQSTAGFELADDNPMHGWPLPRRDEESSVHQWGDSNLSAPDCHTCR